MKNFKSFFKSLNAIMVFTLIVFGVQHAYAAPDAENAATAETANAHVADPNAPPPPAQTPPSVGNNLAPAIKVADGSISAATPPVTDSAISKLAQNTTIIGNAGALPPPLPPAEVTAAALGALNPPLPDAAKPGITAAILEQLNPAPASASTAGGLTAAATPTTAGGATFPFGLGAAIDTARFNQMVTDLAGNGWQTVDVPFGRFAGGIQGVSMTYANTLANAQAQSARSGYPCQIFSIASLRAYYQSLDANAQANFRRIFVQFLPPGRSFDNIFNGFSTGDYLVLMYKGPVASGGKAK